MNALVEASRDPEPMVRVAAVRSLGATGAGNAIGPLLARVVDSARVVRISAAEALLYIGVAATNTPVDTELRKAQEEYAASLLTFPDMASNQTSLAWLRAEQGRTGEATRALRLARALDPRDARPLVYLGVLAARDGRHDEAIADWRAARRLNPRYPNIDRLIDEAMRRSASK